MYTNIAKPAAQTYTNLNKPSNGFMIPKGTATGLIVPPTYATTQTVGVPYTKLAKPSTNSWTNINKPS